MQFSHQSIALIYVHPQPPVGALFLTDHSVLYPWCPIKLNRLCIPCRQRACHVHYPVSLTRPDGMRGGTERNQPYVTFVAFGVAYGGTVKTYLPFTEQKHKQSPKLLDVKLLVLFKFRIWPQGTLVFVTAHKFMSIPHWVLLRSWNSMHVCNT